MTRVKAEAHSDDYHVEVKFDATPWFEQASDVEILGLARIEFGGNYEADVVADFFDENATKELFDYLGTEPTMGKDDPVGFECHVDQASALAWLREHRPSLAAQIEAQSD